MVIPPLSILLVSEGLTLYADGKEEVREKSAQLSHRKQPEYSDQSLIGDISNKYHELEEDSIEWNLAGVEGNQVH